jgi:hypothetical protein
MNKGIILYFLCTNSSCSYSNEKIELKEVLQSTKAQDKFSFTSIKKCPKCKSSVEFLDFVSANVKITRDE